MRALANRAQIDHWNSDDMRPWVDKQPDYDRQLEPFGEAVVAAAAIGTGERILDIGCGCGTTTLRAARPGSRAVGVDVSEPMIERARANARREGATNIEYLVADAQTQPFPPSSFDVGISRFGVMFFDDPVQAFANVRAAIRPGGRLAFCCWQSLARNDWLFLPGMAAAEHLPLPEPTDGPGPFSLGDPAAVVTMLEAAGFDTVLLEPLELLMLVGGGGTVEKTLEFLMHTGIARAMFAGAEPVAADRARAAVRQLLAEHHDGEGVRLGSASWIVTARRP